MDAALLQVFYTDGFYTEAGSISFESYVVPMDRLTEEDVRALKDTNGGSGELEKEEEKALRRIVRLAVKKEVDGLSIDFLDGYKIVVINQRFH